MNIPKPSAMSSEASKDITIVLDVSKENAVLTARAKASESTETGAKSTVVVKKASTQDSSSAVVDKAGDVDQV
jgi:uncharacterized glyoxalase superfamily protein PhnB